MSNTGGARPTVIGVSRTYSKAAVRASLVHFLFGKALNAAVSMTTLIVLARWLGTTDYGSYIALFALQSTLLALSTLGVETAAERFLPEFRTRYRDEDLLGFIVAALMMRTVILLVVVAAGMALAEPLSTLIGLPELTSLLRLWLIAVGCFGVFSFCCVLLESMLLQKLAQGCMSFYLVAKLLLLLALHYGWELNLQSLIVSEIAAGAVAATTGLVLLTRQFHRGGLARGWALVLENRTRLQRFASFNYAAQLVFQFFNNDVMKLLVTRLLGLASAASYGFAANVADMVQRYLPATLLQRLIKPVFISRYVRSGDFGELNRMGRIILKLNLLILVPVIALASVYGGELLGLLSKGRYADGKWLLVGALGLLVLSSHQAILGLLAGTLERNAMQFYAGLLSAIGLPVALWLIPAWGPMGAIAAATISALIYNSFATIYLRRSGYAYKPDWRALLVFAAGGVALAAGLHAAASHIASRPVEAFAAALLLLSFLLFLRVCSAFSPDERKALNTMLPRPVFIF